MKCASIKLSYRIGWGPGQQWPLPATGHQGLLMDMLLGTILVKREEVGNVGGKEREGGEKKGYEDRTKGG